MFRITELPTMAVALFTNVVANYLLKLPYGTAGKVLHQCVRLKSKGKFSGRNTIGKRRGWKKYENDYVERGMIIFRQYGLHVYPGENVGVGRDLTLFAMQSGRIVISREKLSPEPGSLLKPAVDAGEELFKYFFHVVPIDPQPGLFRLVSQI